MSMLIPTEYEIHEKFRLDLQRYKSEFPSGKLIFPVTIEVYGIPKGCRNARTKFHFDLFEAQGFILTHDLKADIGEFIGSNYRKVDEAIIRINIEWAHDGQRERFWCKTLVEYLIGKPPQA